MNIQNYNQKLLAVLGTLGAVFLIVALVGLTSNLIMEHYRYDHNDLETGILSDEKIEELQKEHKREQVISYENLVLVDTLNLVYMVPVSHKTLDEKESINGILNTFTSSDNYEPMDHRYSNGMYGVYNNVILYNQKEETSKKTIQQEKRLNFNKINTEYFENEILLVIKASEKDTYKDGVINLEDLKSLYIYSFRLNKMVKVGIDGMDVRDYKFLNSSKDIVIEFGIDKITMDSFKDIMNRY